MYINLVAHLFVFLSSKVRARRTMTLIWLLPKLSTALFSHNLENRVHLRTRRQRSAGSLLLDETICSIRNWFQ